MRGGPSGAWNLILLWSLELGAWSFEWACQPPLHCIHNRLRRDGAQAFHWLEVGATGSEARLAGQRQLQHMLELAVRTGAPRFGRR